MEICVDGNSKQLQWAKNLDKSNMTNVNNLRTISKRFDRAKN